MLQGRGLAALRGERLVFDGVGFTLAPGGALLLAGPNGAGKSTLLRLIAGLARPDAGVVLWRGEDALADLSAHARRVGYLGHLDAVKPALSVAGNLALWGGRAAVAAALAGVGLAELAEMPGRMLSAGQKRRVALARLTLGEATVWLMDEPSLGLDDASVARLGVLAAAHRAKGGVIVAATHLPLPLPEAEVLRLG